MFKSLLALAFVFSGAAFAHNHEGKEHGTGECKMVKEACEKAGFAKGGHKDGKGLIMDCMGKFAKGEKVEGVALDPADPALKPCMDKMAAHKDQMMEKHDARKAAKKAAKEAGKTGESHAH